MLDQNYSQIVKILHYLTNINISHLSQKIQIPYNENLRGYHPLALSLPYLLSVSDSTRSFLSVSTGELVTDLRCLDRPDAHLGELVALLVEGQHDLVDHSVLGPPHERCHVTLREALHRALQLIIVIRHCEGFPDEGVVA